MTFSMFPPRMVLVFGLFMGLQVGCGKRVPLGPESAQFLATPAQESCGFIQNDFGQRVSWKDQLPSEFFVSKTIPTEFHQDIFDAAQKWNESVGRGVIKISLSDLDGITFSTDDARNVIFGLDKWDEDKSTQQALTIVKYRDDKITSADIKINFQHFIHYAKEPTEPNQVHFASLILHELGHALGLKHAAPRPTVMWPTLASSFIRMQLSPTDKQSIGCEYK